MLPSNGQAGPGASMRHVWWPSEGGVGVVLSLVMLAVTPTTWSRSRAIVVNEDFITLAPEHGLVIMADGIGGHNAIAIGSVGDSRLYRLRANRLEQLTRDHNTERPTEDVAAELVKAATDAGGKDNVSVALVNIVESYPAHRSWFQRFIDWFH